MRALLVILCLLAPAYADKANAREKFRTATQHYDLGEFKDALADYKEAYRNYEDPTFLFNIAQCHRQLGEKEPAIRFFRTYLIKAPDAANREEVREMIGRLEVALQHERAAKQAPPQETMSPGVAPIKIQEAPPPPPATVVVVTPVYKKWWLWTVVGVVAAGVGVGLGVGLTRTPSAPTAATQDGTFHPF